MRGLIKRERRIDHRMEVVIPHEPRYGRKMLGRTNRYSHDVGVFPHQPTKMGRWIEPRQHTNLDDRPARRDRPDVIFLDLVMPGLSGLEVLERLKGDAETRDIPIIINTSRYLDEDERDRMREWSVATLDKSAAEGDSGAAELREALGRAGLGGASSRTEVRHG